MLASVLFLCLISLYELYQIVVKKKMDKERSTVCSHENADDVVKNVPSVLKKNVIVQELQHSDDFIFCVAPFVSFIFDKIS